MSPTVIQGSEKALFPNFWDEPLFDEQTARKMPQSRQWLPISINSFSWGGAL
jgi:hypothetical protein